MACYEIEWEHTCSNATQRISLSVCSMMSSPSDSSHSPECSVRSEVLHGCYRGVTRVLQVSYRGTPEVLQECYKGVESMFLRVLY
jgi:hypothetical protein